MALLALHSIAAGCQRRTPDLHVRHSHRRRQTHVSGPRSRREDKAARDERVASKSELVPLPRVGCQQSTIIFHLGRRRHRLSRVLRESEHRAPAVLERGCARRRPVLQADAAADGHAGARDGLRHEHDSDDGGAARRGAARAPEPVERVGRAADGEAVEEGTGGGDRRAREPRLAPRAQSF